MNTPQKIIAVIERASVQHQRLPIHQTIEIITAYRTISDDPALMDKIIQLMTRYSKQEQFSSLLSPRQNQICHLIGVGFTSKEMAHMLDISVATVSTHRKNIRKKLQLSGAGSLHKIAYHYLHKKEEV